MICRNCNTANGDNTYFCRNCGSSLNDMTPAYDMMPTSVHSLSGNRKLWWAIIPLCLPVVAATICFIVLLLQIFEVDGMYIDTDLLFTTINLIPLGIVLFYYISQLYKKTKSIDLSNLAEYVERRPTNKKYPIVRKNSRYGVYNKKTRAIQIPCSYTSIQWKEKGLILTVSTGSETYDIDIKNNRLK